VIRLKVDEAALIDRVTKRFEAEGRADDNPEAFKKRLVAYNTQTAPLVEVYKGQGKLTEIDGMANVETVASSIAAILDAHKAKKTELIQWVVSCSNRARKAAHKREISG